MILCEQQAGLGGSLAWDGGEVVSDGFETCENQGDAIVEHAAVVDAERPGFGRGCLGLRRGHFGRGGLDRVVEASAANPGSRELPRYLRLPPGDAAAERFDVIGEVVHHLDLPAEPVNRRAASGRK